jgi:hypothetical protein
MRDSGGIVPRLCMKSMREGGHEVNADLAGLTEKAMSVSLHADH